MKLKHVVIALILAAFFVAGYLSVWQEEPPPLTRVEPVIVPMPVPDPMITEETPEEEMLRLMAKIECMEFVLRARVHLGNYVQSPQEDEAELARIAIKVVEAAGQCTGQTEVWQSHADRLWVEWEAITGRARTEKVEEEE